MTYWQDMIVRPKLCEKCIDGEIAVLLDMRTELLAEQMSFPRGEGFSDLATCGGLAGGTVREPQAEARSAATKPTAENAGAKAMVSPCGNVHPHFAKILQNYGLG
jgi:hypothetical protein